MPTETDINAQAVANLRRGPRNLLIVRGTVVASDDDSGDDDMKRSVSVKVKMEGGDAESSSKSRQKGLGSGMFWLNEQYERNVRR